MAEDGIRLPDSKRQKLQADVEADDGKVDANDVLRFHFLDPEQEPFIVENGSPFPAGMCHQHFGPEEMISGYRGLAIDVWLSQRSYLALAEVRYEERQDGADDILEILRKSFPAGLATSRSEYQASLKAAPDNIDLGSLGEPVIERQLDADATLRVYQVELRKAQQAVKDLHARFQPLLLFFVDGASFINPEEPGWELLLPVLHQKGKPLTLVGLATLYKFYCWPDRTRLRVSQVLVPPPHQGRGVGRALLEAAYCAAEVCSAVDVTYEDPTDDLQLIRERIELDRAVKLPWLTELAAKVAQAAASPPPANGHVQESDAAAAQEASSIALDQKEQAAAQASLRVTKQQVRKLWEVLLRAQPALAGEAGVRVLRSLVQARLVSGVTSTRQVAEGKRIVDFPDQGFMMAKVPRNAALSAGMPIAMEGEGAEGESAEVREAALEEAVAKRMEQLDALVAFIQPHMQ